MLDTVIQQFIHFDTYYCRFFGKIDPEKIIDRNYKCEKGSSLKTPSPAFPDGHFYSPIVNVEDVQINESKIWPEKKSVHGIDFNDYSHAKLLKNSKEIISDFDYPMEVDDEDQKNQFYINNSQFSNLDPYILFALLRMLKPKRMIEVGSGFSSLLTADVNRRFFNNTMEFKCIEPFPRKFLTEGVSGVSNLIVEKVMNVSTEIFENLDESDILFIDSSHVCKTGSDVNYLFFDVIPKLKSGVYVHVHDIFLPQDYKKEWVLDEGRSWSEQYVLQALLMYSQKFEVVFGSNYAALTFPNEIISLLEGRLWGGASFWFKVK